MVDSLTINDFAHIARQRRGNSNAVLNYEKISDPRDSVNYGMLQVRFVSSVKADKAQNLEMRTMLCNALKAEFNVESLKQLPKAVRDVLKIGDFKLDKMGNVTSSRPLTARRVTEITKAVAKIRDTFDNPLNCVLKLKLPNGSTFETTPYQFQGQLKEYAKTAGKGLSMEEVRTELSQIINTRIRNGAESVNSILKGAEVPHDAQTAADVVLYLQMLAQSQPGKSFDRGALSVPDKEERLFTFLQSVTDGKGKVIAHTRMSTHLKDVKKMNGYEQHWGFALKRNSVESGLPGGMGAVCFGTLPNARLWLKTETYDTAGIFEPIMHLYRLVKSGESKTGVKHGEDIPKEVKSAYKAMIKKAEKLLTKVNPSDMHNLRNALTKASKNEGMGKNSVARYFEVACDFVIAIENSKNLYDVFKDEVWAFILAIEKYKGIWDGPNSDLSQRVGDEVMLMKSDLGMA